MDPQINKFGKNCGPVLFRPAGLGLGRGMPWCPLAEQRGDGELMLWVLRCWALGAWAPVMAKSMARK